MSAQKHLGYSTVVVTALGAKGLKDVDMGKDDLSDPYAVITFEDQEHKTSVTRSCFVCCNDVYTSHKTTRWNQCGAKPLPSK